MSNNSSKRNFFGKKDKKLSFLGQYEPCFALFKKSNTQNAVMNENRFYIFVCCYMRFYGLLITLN